MPTDDLNARTGNALDFVDTDHCIHVPGINLPQKHNLKRRKNYDSQINEHGKSLLKICKTCDLRIVNGRTSSVSFGRITCHSPKGISMVDYFIVSHEMLNLIGNFVVKEPTIFSEYSQHICWLNLFLQISAESANQPKVKTFNIPKQFIWAQSSTKIFRNTLKQEDILLRLSNFVEMDFNPDCKGVDLATEQFTKILTDTCARSLKVACPKKKPRKHKLWFDKDCALLRKNLNHYAF